MLKWYNGGFKVVMQAETKQAQTNEIIIKAMQIKLQSEKTILSALLKERVRLLEEENNIAEHFAKKGYTYMPLRYMVEHYDGEEKDILSNLAENIEKNLKLVEITESNVERYQKDIEWFKKDGTISDDSKLDDSQQNELLNFFDL